MAMVEVGIKVDDAGLQAALNIIQAGNLPNTKKVFNAITNDVKNKWKDWAIGGDIPGAEPIKKPNSKLRASIKSENSSSFTTNIFTESQYMERIENGVKAFDMKEKYPYGKKSRVGASGKPYLIIPFRWGVGDERAHFGPNFISKTQNQYLIQGLTHKLDTTHTEKNFRGEDITRAEYGHLVRDTMKEGFGNRITEFSQEHTDDDGNLTGYDLGAVKMAGGGGVFTFRIISPKNELNAGKWLRKEIPANHVVEALAEYAKDSAGDSLATALQADILGM